MTTARLVYAAEKSYSLVNDYLSQAFNVFAENSILVSKYTKEHLMEYFIKVIKKLPKQTGVE